MPKPVARAGIHLDLLKPQSNPEKITVRLFKWLLTTGRFIFIIVEALVLVVFIARFKIDADLQSMKESIDEQVPYIQSMKQYEVLIRQTQMKLSTIAAFKQANGNYAGILKMIADETPQGLKISSLNMDKKNGRITVQMNGQAQTNNDIAYFLSGLKNNRNFSDVNLSSIGIETDSLHFSISLTARPDAANQSI